MKMHFKSFTTRLSIYILSFTLVVFITVMSLFYVYGREKIKDYTVSHTHGQLQNMATRIHSLLETVEVTMEQSVWMVEDGLVHPDSLSRVLAAVVRNNDLIVGSGVAFEPNYYKEKGRYFMPYISLQQGKTVYQVLGSVDYDYPYMDWYLIPKLLRRNYWSEPYYDDGGGNMIMSTYSVPLYDAKKNVYAIFTANISLAQFTDMVDGLKPYASSYSFLLSRNGSYLTHRDRLRIMNETIFAGAFDKQDADQEYVGREMLAGHTGTKRFGRGADVKYAFYTAIPDIGWSVCNVCPEGVIFKDLGRTLQWVVYIFLAGMLVLFFITYGIIRRVMRPLVQFSQSARTIATGRFDVKLPEVNSHDEIRDLYDSLSYMQQSLSDYVVELRETTASKERINSELTIAREIQMGMIPKIFPPFPERRDVDLYALLQSAKEVGGDLYDFFIDNNHLYFVVGDVSGKGVPASLFMAITRCLFRTLAPSRLSPSAIVAAMNNSISDSNESNMFVTMIVGILDLQNGALKLCNAGHNPPVVICPDGKVAYHELKKHLVVGMMHDFCYTDDELILEKGCKLFIYTDGVTEAENEVKEFYGEERLLKTLADSASLDVHALIDRIRDAVAMHVQAAEQSDDLTMLVIHYEPEIPTNHTR